MRKSIAGFVTLFGLAGCMALASGLTAADRSAGIKSTRTASRIPTIQQPTLEERVNELAALLDESQERIADLENQLSDQEVFLAGLQEHISIDGSGHLEIEAIEIDLNAWTDLNISSSHMSVESAMADFAGVIQSEVVHTKSVISTTYTPGAGNML